MTILQLGLSGTLLLLLAGAGFWCLQVALRYERPTWPPTIWLPFACWWVGQLLAWILLAILTGGLVGLAARAAWLVGGG